VSLVQRVLRLKALPVFADVSPDVVAQIAELQAERHFHPGEALFRAGEFPQWFHFVVDGLVTHSSYAPGTLAVLEQRPYETSCIARTPVHALRLRAEDAFDALEDRFEVARSLLGGMARHCLGLQRRSDITPPSGAPWGMASGPLDLIQRIVVLKSVPILKAASIEELVRLAPEVLEMSILPGDALFRAGDAASAFHVVLRGRVAGYGPRTSIGMLEALAQDVHPTGALVEEPTQALRVPSEPFFDLLEDHFHLVRAAIRDLGGRIRLAVALAQPSPPARVGTGDARAG
jgi:CRP-like cAMP-binding protein